MRRLASLLLLVLGCSRPSGDPNERAPALVERPVSSASAKARCTQDSECTLCSNGERGLPMLKTEAESAGTRCEIGFLAEPWNPQCQDGKCGEVEPPSYLRCRNNDDCALCFDGSPCGYPMAKDRIAFLDQSCRKGSSGQCRRLDLICDRGRCKDASLINQ